MNVYRAYLHAYASFGWIFSILVLVTKPDVGLSYMILRFRGIACANNASFNLLVYKQTNSKNIVYNS